MIDTDRFAGMAGRITALLPAPPDSWRRVTGGYRADPRWRIELADGGSVFVKVATDRAGADDLAHELAVYHSIGADFLPGLVAWDLDDPPILVLEDLSGERWPPPYPEDPTPLFDALSAVASTSPPAPAREPHGADGTWWGRIAAEPRGFLALGLCGPEWLETVLADLERAERTVDVAGDELVHGDVFAANLCFTPRGAVLVDWSEWFRGDGRFDVACALLALRREGAAAPAVGLDDEAGWAALLAGHLAVVATRPPPSWVRPESGLRDEQIRDLEHALRWCEQALELPPRGPDRRAVQWETG